MQWAAGLSLSGVPINQNPAKIINLSLGSASECNAAYAETINQLRYLGISVVASAGNDSALINTPANCNGVISVVGVRHTGTKVGYSSLGPQATIAAPAGNCVNLSGACLFPLDTTINLGTTFPSINDYSDQYDANLGTSFSAPVVSGTIALMLGVNKDLTPDQVKWVLQSSAKPFPQTADTTCEIPTSHTPVQANESECNCTTSTCGAGLLNAYQAVINSRQPAPTSSGGGGSVDLLSCILLCGLTAMKLIKPKGLVSFGLT
jgi:serine protease